MGMSIFHACLCNPFQEVVGVVLMSKTLQIAVIGAGRVGSTLAYALHRHGHRIISIASRKLDSARRLADIVQAEPTEDVARSVAGADIVFLTVPDAAIQDVCKLISHGEWLKPGSFVFHTSGALSSEVLTTARESGAYVASLHPLQSFASMEEGLENLPGTFFVIEGDAQAIECGMHLVKQMGGRLLNISTETKPLYHAGACVASNFVVSVVRMAVELLQTIGVDADNAYEALTPLVVGTFRNIQSLGVPQALTGPISRGDTETLSKHLDALNTYRSELLPVYLELARYTVKVALEKGTIDEVAEKALLEVIESWRDAK